MTSTGPTDMRLPTWAAVLFGVISLAAGVAALVWPEITILVLVSLLGIQILIYGVIVMVRAFQTGEARILAVIFGVLSLLAGTALWLRPLRNLGAVVVVLAVFWIVGGVMQVIGSFIERDEGWGAELASGVVSALSGFILIAWPAATLLVMAILAGIWMVIIGLIQIFVAFSGRRAQPAAA